MAISRGRTVLGGRNGSRKTHARIPMSGSGTRNRCWKQFSSAGETNGYQQLVPVEADLKTLARTFSAVLTGQIDRDVPVSHVAPVWGVFRAAIKGDITSPAEQFCARLAEHPLSEHWLAPRKKLKASANKSSLLPLVACLGLLLLGGLERRPPRFILAASWIRIGPRNAHHWRATCRPAHTQRGRPVRSNRPIRLKKSRLTGRIDPRRCRRPAPTSMIC